MRLIPAIDIRGGRCVRLLQGDFEKETRYDADPIALAARYRALGAEWLHVVDLDGAAAGAPANLPLVRSMRAEGLQVQLGGGIRDRAALERALESADRVVLGSLAVVEPERVADWLEAFGAERLTLGFDVRIDGAGTPFVTTHGWRRTSELTLSDAVERFAPHGLRHVLCTDVARDGMLGGPNVDLYAECVRRWPALALQASGGIRDAADLAALAATGVAAAISGKALLEGRLSVAEIAAYS
ncbi:MAG TPA: HisA/HisF-related TIM barrel protein [Gammaproteobacteria bacterium]